MDKATEYSLLLMNYLLHLSLDLNMWFISVEDKGGNISLPSMSTIPFELDRQTFDAPHMPNNFVYTPLAPSPAKKIKHAAPAPAPATLQY